MFTNPLSGCRLVSALLVTQETSRPIARKIHMYFYMRLYRQLYIHLLSWLRVRWAGQIKQFIAFLLCASIAHIDRPSHPPGNAAIVRESAAKMFCTIYFCFSHAGYARLEFQTEFIDRHYVTNGGIFQKLSRRSLFLTVMPKWVAEISAPSCRRENRLVVYTHTHMYIYVYQGGIYSWTD